MYKILQRIGLASNQNKEKPPDLPQKEVSVAVTEHLNLPPTEPSPMTLLTEDSPPDSESSINNQQLTLNLEPDENDCWGVTFACGSKPDGGEEWTIMEVKEGEQFHRKGARAGHGIVSINGELITSENSHIIEILHSGNACTVTLEMKPDNDEDDSESSGLCISLDALFSGELIGGGLTPSDNEEISDEENESKMLGVQEALSDLQQIAEKSLVIQILSVGTDDANTKVIANLHELITDSSFTCHMTDKWITLRSCFNTPSQLSEFFLYKVINKWNCNRRFTRMYIDDDGDLMLQAEVPSVSTGKTICTKQLMRKVLWSFFIAIIDHQRFMVSEISEQPEATDIESFTTPFVCGHEHLGEKCVMCMDSFKTGDKCLQLRCGHVFHQEEILKHLYNNPGCPICRTNFKG